MNISDKVVLYRHEGSSMLCTTVYGSNKCDMSHSPFGRSLFSAERRTVWVNAEILRGSRQ